MMDGDKAVSTTPPKPVIVVCGMHGGARTTATASRIIRALADRHAAIGIDLDLWSGNLAAVLGHRELPSATIADMAAIDADEVGASAVEAISYPVRHARVRVVPSACDPVLAEVVTHQHVARLIGAARLHSSVVVDAGSRFDERTLAACQHATAIVICALRSRIGVGLVRSRVVELLLSAGIEAPVCTIDALVVRQLRGIVRRAHEQEAISSVTMRELMREVDKNIGHAARPLTVRPAVTDGVMHA